jgi:hypothetical protein
MTQALIVPSTMTPREFGVIFSRLATQLQWRDADVSSAASYYEALKNYTLDTIHESGKRLAMEQGRRFFPTTGEWAEVADAVQHEALRRAVKPARDEPWHFDCETCTDTGWKHHDCDGSEQCGRRKKHAPHVYVTPCPCREMNRTYQRHQKFGAGE